MVEKLWQRANYNARDVSFTVANSYYQPSWWNQIIFNNYPQQRSTTVSLETYSLHSVRIVANQVAAFVVESY